jgi:DivIVA domain-containing protein
MDVTPQELRDIDIRESWRGYHRDEVDELLERAAATIEHLEHQIRILQERLAAGPAPQPAAQAAPTAPARPAPVPTPVPVPDSDIIQRTLILAQKAADEAVAEAQARAHQLSSESEAKAHALVSEAESTARRIAETERRRMETEIAQLAATRDALNDDVSALEKFSGEYRDRIRQAIEAELASLSRGAGEAEPPPPRPELKTEGMAFASPAPLGASSSTSTSAEAPAPALDLEPTASIEAVEAVEEVVEVEAAPSWTASQNREEAWSPEPAGGWGGGDSTDEQESGGGVADIGAATASEPIGSDAVSDDDLSAESLDDDAFFASLRDAVRDDEPLGPRDNEYFDDEDAESSRKLFRRRR